MLICLQEIELPLSAEELFFQLTSIEYLKKRWLDRCTVQAADGHLRESSEVISLGDRFEFVDREGVKVSGHLIKWTRPTELGWTIGVYEGFPLDLLWSIQPLHSFCRIKLILGNNEYGFAPNSTSKSLETYWKGVFFQVLDKKWS